MPGRAASPTGSRPTAIRAIPNVDVVNWIERIPFTETRNYVQRIMENLQVYRARLGSPALTIETDLKRGG